MAVTRVVGYVRVSTEQQADGGVSLDAQRAKLVAYATALDLTLVDVVVDAGVSAKTLDRPGLRRVLGMLETREADGVLVAKLDRLTRSVRDLGDLVDRYFAERPTVRACTLMSVADSIDTRSAGGRLVLNVLASVSQWEREAIGERTRDALVQVRREGVRLGGEAMGWRRTEDTDASGRRTVVAVDEEIATVERIQELHASGLSVRAIASTLTAEGAQTKRGGRWHPTQVQRVLARGRVAA